MSDSIRFYPQGLLKDPTRNSLRPVEAAVLAARTHFALSYFFSDLVVYEVKNRVVEAPG